MTGLIKQVQMIFVLFLGVTFFNALFMADAYAETAVDDLRKKGQQCIDWKKSAEKAQNASVTGCLMSCARFAEMAAQNPDLLTEDRINNCNEAHAEIERIVSGEPPIPVEVDQPPETIEGIVKDMKKVEQECKAKVDSATTPKEKRSAEACYNTCYRGALKISRGGVPVEQAKTNWKMCVGFKK